MCECKNAYLIEEQIPGKWGRGYIEKLSEEDKKLQINSHGRLASENAWGEIQWHCPDCKQTLGVICGHGGSMWLCRQCKERMIKDQGTEIQARRK